jgi:AAA family ATP:ADP antiporter
LLQSLQRLAPLGKSHVGGGAGRVGRSSSSSSSSSSPSSSSSALLRSSSSGLDPILTRSVELRSGDPDRVRAALAGPPLEAAHVAVTIPLLAWDEVAARATSALERVAARVTGQLVDALLDPDEEFTVRRRLPRILASAPSPRSIQGLLYALRDTRFEVRFRAARALARMHVQKPELPIDAESVYAAILRELAVDEPTFRNPAILDEESGESFVADEVLRDRVSRGLEHVFTLLTLVLPGEPIRIAFRALHTTDPSLHGTAIEYLEQVLPASVREKLWPRIELEATRPTAPRPRAPVESAEANLMESRAAISRSLEAFRKSDV